MLQAEHSNEICGTSIPELDEAEALANDLKHLLVRSEKELIHGDAREHIEKIERWVESYRRGLAAAQKISDSGVEMLHKTRDQLALALQEQLRLEDEGGNPASKDQSVQVEQLSSAVRRIDRLIPILEHSFHLPALEEDNIY